MHFQKFSLFFFLCLLVNHSKAKAQSRASCDGIKITSFKIFNSELPLDSVLKKETIELSHRHNSFSIGYTLTDSLLHSFFYQLEGADKNWIAAPASSVVNYTLLSPGTYSFRIKCQDKSIAGTSEYVALRINIKLPFWLSGWFIIVCFLVFVGSIYYLHTQSLKRLMAVETVRQKVSRDLHDDVGSTLSTINILSMMAKSKMKQEPAKTLEYLDKISDNCIRMMEAMDDIVWSINPANDTMQKIMARMRSFATEVLEPKNVELLFHFDQALQDVQLNMEERRDLFLLFKEAINNAAKYSGASQVSVDMRLKNQTLQLMVTDNGIGFNVNKADSGNGLNNMQKRAEKLKAIYLIDSETGRGTKMKLEMPIT